ncbi:hypothetical protein [Desulfoluna spongiiphila]|uniref:Capsular polysaccharide biosynthesis protein n=1 Tax=Desulfoluna spongiiphila TaxID=419481 RepID=A0A1G5C024_9BACT|nr:hypothetical protein [Desulfoluna spongiiphila]SCX95738.1 Capsular polysaccharide biosynthesis protein [Desulfoluna spongiiphila]
MLFYIRRMLYRINRNHRYLSLVIALPLLFLMAMAYKPHTFAISLSFPSPADAPVTAPESPTEAMTLSDLTASPGQAARFIKGNFFPHLIIDYPLGYKAIVTQAQRTELYAEARENLTIGLSEEAQVIVTYTGKNRKTGERLVTYYGNTLFRRIQEGYKRLDLPAPPPMERTPEMTYTSRTVRRIWEPSRLIPALICFAGGLLLFVLAQAIVEALDPSYKSEKQIAEHLGVPILGSLPNISLQPLQREHDEQTR